MKKLLSIAVASFAVATIADPFSPTIGVTKIPLTYKDTIISVPFASLTDGGNISVTDLVCTNGLTVGEDILYVFENNTYTGWLLTEAGWTKATTQTPTGDPGSSDGKVASAGAIWISLQNAPAANKTVSIYGKWVNQAETVTAIAAATATADKQNLVANPLQSNAFAIVSNAAKGDTIIFPKGDTIERYVYNNSRSDANTYVWRKNSVVIDPQKIPVGIGQGFWYVRAKGSQDKTDATITWEAAQ